MRSELINTTQAWDKENSESLTGIESMTPKHTAGALSTELWELMCLGGYGFNSYWGLRIFFFHHSIVSCWSIHLSHFITELKIHHDYSLITTHDDFDSAEPTRMQDACHLWTQLNDRALPVAQWIEHPPCVQEVMSLIPVGVSEFSIFIPHSCHVD